MNIDTTNVNHLWASLIVEELSRLGVQMVTISPGSRSTPLVVAAARCDKLRKTVHFDERGAAFYALGYARATGIPTALICTSGTAVANYLPAIIEASQDRIPLIVLTADRPPELRDTGANQTILQPGLYGPYVRWQFDMPCPTAEIDPAMVLTTIDQAVFRATGSPAGPVHLNCAFREPLAPIDDGISYDKYVASLAPWRTGTSAFTTYAQTREVSAESLDEIKSVIASARRGLVIVGRLAQRQDVIAVRDMAQHLGWPVIPDIQSQLRLGADDAGTIAYADLVLSSETAASRLAPDVILHMGDQIVSKRILQLFTGTDLTALIRITDHPFRHDPAHRVTHRINSPIAAVCGSIAHGNAVANDKTYGLCWQKADRAVAGALQSILSSGSLSGPAIAFHLSRLLSAEHALFLASSLAIRNVDTFAAPDGASVTVAANRGASGIDGTIASAVGFAEGLGRPLTLLIGDLALLHDLNSLELVRRSSQPITIVVLNDDGGGIFGLLPVAEVFAELDKYFIAPHGHDFVHVASQFGLTYAKPRSRGEFEQAYRQSAGTKSALIELTIDRQADRELRRQLLASIDTAVGTL